MERKEALVAHGREVLERFKGKELSHLTQPDMPSSSTSDDHTTTAHATDSSPLLPRQDKLWSTIVNSHVENGQLSESIERNALKLVDYILANDKSSHSNLAQIAAPIASAVRQLCHKKQQVEAAILRDIKLLGPPLVVDSTTTNSSAWVAASDVQTLVNAHTSSLQEELHAAQKANQSLEVKLHAYKLQLQQTSDMPPATTDMTISAKKPVELQLQEKDELIAALKITLDEVARETSQMEKLVVVQMDMIAELKHATAAGPVPVMLPPPSTDDVDEGHHHPDSQQSEGEAVPVDDGLVHKIEDFQTPLPPGWEMRVTTSGNVYFVHITSKVTTWVDPRTHPIQVQTTGLDNTSFPSPSTQYSMEFHEKRRIGIMFQPNFPIDQGASVHRVLPDTPAALARQIHPGHQLVAVNGHPIHDASFKHVMLLLQGGYRPLILTFDRGNSDTPSGGDRVKSDDDLSFADRIITSVFSMMWSMPPEEKEPAHV
ncbi:hypothetical protein H257_00661 [Aphanomyces astaci]|uniref:WW domain-containing protein n=1 Tax=Aphanomyces astaci TaxID=112090 RepID=W4HCM3_APHAT|nr:hypothetical protein H257_00661 [Aphanomyces astaci]ETV89336.1 hypothetical protein H257_00661 [Aphanomyces astaci]|eukprot:XP_009821736.1 hypothetical protein H257_00661 [Aphanomyces astaci]